VHAPAGEGSASALGPTAQSEYPAARKVACAAKATPSWAPRRAGRAALTTAIATASVTIVPLGRGGQELGSTAVAGERAERGRRGGGRVALAGFGRLGFSGRRRRR